MKRCDPNARAKCPDGETCELYAEFADGSWCDDFNKKVLKLPMTNANRIRAMSDEELADFLNRIVVNHHIKIADECRHCPLSVAKPCDTEGIINWLQQPAGEVQYGQS